MEEIGFEPPIAAGGPSAPRRAEGSALARWLAGVVLIAGLGGGSLCSALRATLGPDAVTLQAPEIAGQDDFRTAETGAVLRRGDRLFRAPDIAAEKVAFTAPIVVGDRPVIRSRGFVRIATTLAVAHTRFFDQVPKYDPSALAARKPGGAPGPDPGAAPEMSDVSFRVVPLTDLDGSHPVEGSTDADVAAEVDRFASGTSPAAGSILPHVQRRADGGEVDLGVVTSSLPLLNVSIVPQNVTAVPRADPSSAGVADTFERMAVLRRGQSLEALLRDEGATTDQAASVAATLDPRVGRPPVAEGRRLRLTLASLDGHGPAQIVRLSVLSDEGVETTVAADDHGRYVRIDPPALGRGGRTGMGEVEDGEDGLPLYDSLYETALRQGMPRPTIDDLVRVVGEDVDLKRAVAAGDTLDAFYSDGNAPGHNHLLFASLTVRGETFKYYRFRSEGAGGTDYLDEQGRSTRKFLIREPVPSARISSPFGVRSHPILGYSRPHNGVDFAAPGGTPILAAGDGTVKEAVHSSSYGNHVEIQHENGYATTYSHMAAFARGIAAGVQVRQGQVVGYIGQTGLATGPHLHYEVIVNGHYVDPMRVRLGRTVELTGKALDAYARERARIDALMAGAGDGLQASNLPPR